MMGRYGVDQMNIGVLILSMVCTDPVAAAVDPGDGSAGLRGVPDVFPECVRPVEGKPEVPGLLEQGEGDLV